MAKLGLFSEDEDFELPADCVPALLEFANEVEHFLTACLKIGACCIVTNGLTGWVESSCQRFLPNVVPLVEQMTVISARSAFERVLPDRPIEWKIAVYRDVLAIQLGASVELSTADRDADLRRVARSSTPEATLRRIDAIMECRRRINANVHPQIAMEAMTAALYLG